MVPLSSRPSSFDHLVGAEHDGLRNREAEGLRCSHVDQHLELGRLLDWKIGGPFPPLKILSTYATAKRPRDDCVSGVSRAMIQLPSSSAYWPYSFARIPT